MLFSRFPVVNKTRILRLVQISTLDYSDDVFSIFCVLYKSINCVSIFQNADDEGAENGAVAARNIRLSAQARCTFGELRHIQMSLIIGRLGAGLL